MRHIKRDSGKAEKILRQVYIPEIDGLRAIAVLAVLVYHLNAAWLPSGYSGVDVFFVISGYVVTASLQRDTVQPLSQLLVRFYARRVIRIMPALLVCLMLTTALTILFIPPSWLSQSISQTGLAAFFGFSNIVLTWQDSYFAPAPEFNPFTHTWSLGVEEQFYLVFPVLLFLAVRLSGWPRMPAGTPLLAVGACSVASFLLMAAVSRGHPDVAFFWLPCRFWELGVGAALCLARLRQPLGLRAAVGQWLGCALLLLGFVAADNRAFPFPWAVPSVAGTVLLIANIGPVATGRPLPSWILGSAPLVAIGRISYSLYLWHWVVFTMFRWTVGLTQPALMVAAVLLSFLMAWLSTTLIEDPIRHSVRLPDLSRGKVVAGGAVAMAACSALAWVGYSYQMELSLTSVGRNHTEWYGDPSVAKLSAGGCPMQRDEQLMAELVQRVHVGPECGSAKPRPPHLYVLGDSHAEAYAPMLNRAAAELDIDVTRYRRSNCSIANLLRPSPPACVQAAELGVVDVLKTGRPGDVVFLAALRMVKLAGPYRALTPKQLTHDTESAEVLQGRTVAYQEASDVIGRLQSAGFIVVIDEPKPVFPVNPFRCADWWTESNPVCAGGLVVDRATLLRYRAPFMQMIEELAARHPGLIAFDTFDTLCPDAACQAVTAAGPMFIDGDHLTGAANRVLYPMFRRLLDRVVWKH